MALWQWLHTCENPISSSPPLFRVGKHLRSSSFNSVNSFKYGDLTRLLCSFTGPNHSSCTSSIVSLSACVSCSSGGGAGGSPSWSLSIIIWYWLSWYNIVQDWLHSSWSMTELVRCSRLTSQQLVYNRARQESWVAPCWRLACPQYVRYQVGIFNNRSSKPEQVYNRVRKVLVFVNTCEHVRTCSGRKWLKAFCERVSEAWFQQKRTFNKRDVFFKKQFF